MNKLDVVEFFKHANWKKSKYKDFTGSVIMNCNTFDLHLFYAINGERVSDKEWFNLNYSNKLEDLLNE